MDMNIKEFINNNYNYISAIAVNEYNKEKNKVLYKQYATDDFISEVMLFLLKKYKSFDETLCKQRTFIIKNCCYCAGELKARLNKSTRYIDLITSNESDLITKDENNNDLNAYENIGKEDYYQELSIFSDLTDEERRLIKYKLHGLTMKEMCKIEGVSRPTIWRKFKIIENKLC